MRTLAARPDPAPQVDCRRMLIAIDTADDASVALAMAADLIASGPGRIRAIHVRTWESLDGHAAEHPGCAGPHVFGEDAETAVTLMDAILAEAHARGLHAETKILQAPRGLVATTLDSAARAWDADLMILPARGDGDPGSASWREVSQELSRTAVCPVLVAVDPSGASSRAD